MTKWKEEYTDKEWRDWYKQEKKKTSKQTKTGDDKAKARSDGASSSSSGSQDDWEPYFTWNDKTGAVKLVASGRGFRSTEVRSLCNYFENKIKDFTGWCRNDAERHDGNSYGTYIDLTDNEVSDTCLESWIGPFLSRWPVCQKLKLSGNKEVTDKGIKALTAYVKYGFCEELVLTDLPQVSDEGIKPLLNAAVASREYPHRGNGGKYHPLRLSIGGSMTPRLKDFVHRKSLKIEFNRTENSCDKNGPEVVVKTGPQDEYFRGPPATKKKLWEPTGDGSNSTEGSKPGEESKSGGAVAVGAPSAGGGSAGNKQLTTPRQQGAWGNSKKASELQKTPDLMAEASFPSLDQGIAAGGNKVKTSNTLGLQGLVRWGQAPDSVFGKQTSPPTNPAPPTKDPKGGKGAPGGSAGAPGSGGQPVSSTSNAIPPTSAPGKGGDSGAKGQPQSKESPPPAAPSSKKTSQLVPIWIAEEQLLQSARLLPIEGELLRILDRLREVENMSYQQNGGKNGGSNGAGGGQAAAELRQLHRRLGEIEENSREQGGRTLNSLQNFGYDAAAADYYFYVRPQASTSISKIWRGLKVRRRFRSHLAEMRSKRKKAMSQKGYNGDSYSKQEGYGGQQLQGGMDYNSAKGGKNMPKGGAGANGKQGFHPPSRDHQVGSATLPVLPSPMQPPGSPSRNGVAGNGMQLQPPPAKPSNGMQQEMVGSSPSSNHGAGGESKLEVPSPSRPYPPQPPLPPQPMNQMHPQQRGKSGNSNPNSFAQHHPPHHPQSPSPPPYPPSPSPGPSKGPTLPPPPTPPLKKEVLQENWFYKGNDGSQQGPYTVQRMRNWFLGGYFKRELMIKCESFRDFYELQQLWPHSAHHGGNAFEMEPCIPQAEEMPPHMISTSPPQSKGMEGFTRGSSGNQAPASHEKSFNEPLYKSQSNSSPVQQQPATDNLSSSGESAKDFAAALASQFEKLSDAAPSPTEDADSSALDRYPTDVGSTQPMRYPTELPPPAPVPLPPQDDDDDTGRASASAGAGASWRNKTEEVESEDDGSIQDTIFMVEPRYVGLIIGKSGETIKKFTNMTGSAINIDQDVPAGIPRAVIMHGTKKQNRAAEQLIKNLIKKAKDDEEKTSDVFGGRTTGSLSREADVPPSATGSRGMMSKAKYNPSFAARMDGSLPDSGFVRRGEPTQSIFGSLDASSPVAPKSYITEHSSGNRGLGGGDLDSHNTPGNAFGSLRGASSPASGGEHIGASGNSNRAQALREHRPAGGASSSSNWRRLSVSDSERAADMIPSASSGLGLLDRANTAGSTKTIYDLMTKKPSWAVECSKGDSEYMYSRSEMLYFRHLLIEKSQEPGGEFVFAPKRFDIGDRPQQVKKEGRTPMKKRIDCGITLDNAPEAGESVYAPPGQHPDRFLPGRGGLEDMAHSPSRTK
ncbi:unnamed protein product [Amoebophrya sp. A25]|nr:unnamed protein product [Amoebophrya sp. A25]|eukprot:GSA25T00022494001.1